MSVSLVYVGMDVSKHTLDLHTHVGTQIQRRQLPNTAAGHRQLTVWLKQLGNTHLICEPSGGYQLKVVEAVLAAGLTVSSINAQRGRQFAQSQGLLAKTDRLDAAMLARYGSASQPKPDQPLSPAEQQLRELMTRRQQLIELRTSENNRLEHTTASTLRRQIQQHIKALNNQIKQVDGWLQQLQQDQPVLAQKLQRLTQICGVGTTTALNVLASMPELGRLNRRQAAALAGLAPMNKDSGRTQHGRRYIQAGRAALRRALYMAALVAARHNPRFREFYRRLITAGKAPKVALVAVMRKLIIVLNRILADPTFQPT